MSGDHEAPGSDDLVPVMVRRWMYGVATAVVPLLVVYGIVADDVAPLWVALLGQVLATGTATAYTPTSTSP